MYTHRDVYISVDTVTCNHRSETVWIRWMRKCAIMLSHVHCVLMLLYSMICCDIFSITTRDTLPYCQLAQAGWSLMPAVSHSNDVGTYFGDRGRVCPRWAYQASFTDSLEADEKDYSSSLFLSTENTELYLHCRQYKTLEEFHLVIGKPKNLD